MSLNTPEHKIAKDENLLETSRTSLRELAAEIENLKKQIRSGEDANLKEAATKLAALDGWLRNYVTVENRLAELRRKHCGPEAGGLALDLERARFEIGCRLARLRTARCKGCVPR